MEALKQQELDSWKNRSLMDKDQTLHQFEEQKRREIKQLQDSHQYAMGQLQLEHEQTLRYTKNQFDQKLCKLSD